MCDTIVAVSPSTADAAVWFGKNSDREPGEAQFVEHLPARRHPARSRVQCTYVELAQASHTCEAVISRPFWMWGAEMGANEHGVAIGNEAVFTRLPVPKTGLTGMDLLRLALERATSAREALDLITHWIATIGQGGLCGHRHKGFRYHNSFLIADPGEAWVLETADRHWAAEKVRGVRTISNALTIGREFDLLSTGAFEFARRQGWCRSADNFDFARAFGDPLYRVTSGADLRRACTYNRLIGADGSIGRERFFAALRDHAGHAPADGWRMQMPCAHASWQITRQSGQTTGSMVSRLSVNSSLHWLTGTSSPCLSVFKPFVLAGEPISTGPLPDGEYDPNSLYWRHERLHRAILNDYARFQPHLQPAQQQLEARFCEAHDLTAQRCQSFWDEHRQILPAWTDDLERLQANRRRATLGHRFWRMQNRLDRIP
ncbi:MAG: C69 family dipeptidase [Blastocatellia bacterium]|nr:C69 family dipeptidase [Blastocatellia bacterium]